MQKLVQKAVFAALLVSSSAFANGDLLSQATDGAISAAKVQSAEVKVLSNDEMKDVAGAGWRAPIYRAAFSTFTTTRSMTPMQRLSAFTRVNW